MNYATCLIRIVHVPSLNKLVERLYATDQDKFPSDDYKCLALFYAVLALGCMYDISEDDPTNPNTYKTAMDEG